MASGTIPVSRRLGVWCVWHRLTGMAVKKSVGRYLYPVRNRGYIIPKRIFSARAQPPTTHLPFIRSTMLRILLWPVLVLLLRRHDGISILAFTQKPLVSLRYRTTALPAASFTALVNLDETAARDVSALEDWAAAYGVQTAEGFSIVPAQESHEDENNFGVVTNVDLPAESPVLYVPSELILTGSTARQALDGPALQQALELLGRLEKEDDVTQEFALFCKVLVEYEKGDASPYYPWLNAMPRIYYNGASMTRTS